MMQQQHCDFKQVIRHHKSTCVCNHACGKAGQAGQGRAGQGSTWAGAPGRVCKSASCSLSGSPVEKPWTYNSGVVRPSGSRNTCTIESEPISTLLTLSAPSVGTPVLQGNHEVWVPCDKDHDSHNVDARQHDCSHLTFHFRVGSLVYYQPSR